MAMWTILQRTNRLGLPWRSKKTLFDAQEFVWLLVISCFAFLPENSLLLFKIFDEKQGMLVAFVRHKLYDVFYNAKYFKTWYLAQS